MSRTNAVADKVFYNGIVYSMDQKSRVAQGLAVSGNTIIAVGSNQEVLSLRGPHTQVYDLKGKAVIPGLIDTHTHLFWAAVSELDGELFIPESIEQLLEYIRVKAIQLPKGEWIYLPNTYPARLKEHRYPTIDQLDEVAPHHPVFIDGVYSGRANSCALRMAGIKEGANASSTLSALRKCIKRREYDLADCKEGIKILQRRYNEMGITSVVDGASNELGIKALCQLYRQKELSLRVACTLVVSDADKVEEEAKKYSNIVDIPSEWVKLSFIKIMLDGGILTCTAFMKQGYGNAAFAFDIPEGYRGVINYNSSQIIPFIDRAYEFGYQMSAHCIGDGALQVLLEAYRIYNEKFNDITDRRFSIIHGDFTDDAALDMIKFLKLVLLFQPAWHFKDAGFINEMLSKDVMDIFLPYSKYVEKGIHAAAGSDHMVKYDPLMSHNPYNPFCALYNMLTRRTYDGHVIGEEHCIDREQALRFYTEKAAYATFEEDKKGCLKAGKLADFVVLSKDYFECPVEDIPSINALLTVVGGKVVFDRMYGENDEA
ncbi:MAG: amidohydrolase [Caldicoprobacter oshimai]|uniref:Amidohydrolase 3 domain-containing protein n=1 Tax=Caldicoprobacter faecalis TaxID=937334 RepID=A0A1I5THB5_9FIRM|nr:amidohydrolase [Caldicoprobacter faecalis]PZN11023.1 MAG: amidohydrolase [Caldicoprobacter oshimai]SFP82450.1 hypothetical protein SAMN05444406_104127 [Caldicoprobacter faecalis]